MIISVCSITLFIFSRLFFHFLVLYADIFLSLVFKLFFVIFSSFFLPHHHLFFYYFLFIHHSLVLFFSLACLHCLHLSLTPPFSFSVILYPFHSFVFFSLLSFFYTIVLLSSLPIPSSSLFPIFNHFFFLLLFVFVNIFLLLFLSPCTIVSPSSLSLSLFYPFLSSECLYWSSHILFLLIGCSFLILLLVLGVASSFVSESTSYTYWADLLSKSTG